MLLIKATLTWDQTGTVPNRTGPDCLLFTWDHSGTSPEQIQIDPKFDLSKSGSSFGSIWICSELVPKNRRPIYLIRFLDQIHLEPVPCKHGISSGKSKLAQLNLLKVPQVQCGRLRGMVA